MRIQPVAFVRLHVVSFQLHHELTKAAVNLIRSGRRLFDIPAHRLPITTHDLGIRADGAVIVVCYGLAALGTVVTGYFLIVD